jgi:hypothetical protein
MKGRATSCRFGPPLFCPLFSFGISYLEVSGIPSDRKLLPFLWKRCPGQAARCISLMGYPQELRLRIVGLQPHFIEFALL